MTPTDMLEIAAELAGKAAAAILGVRAAGFAVDRKADYSPVTEADRIAEVLIVEGLRAAFPDIPVVAEEEVAGGLVTAVADRFWLVDPLDGTREFSKGRDEFAVCIGLVEHGRATLGALAVPAADEVFGGILGQGAWKQDGQGRRAISARRPPASGLLVMASRHDGDDPRLQPYLAGQKVDRVVNAGSALKFARLAEGAADLYPRFGRTMEWDTAAGQALLEAAGGRMARVDGQPFRYGKPGFENPGFICHGAA